MKKPLEQQVVVIAGASSGIDRATGEPKPVDSPDNLHETIPADPGAHGRFDATAKGSSGWTEARIRLGKAGSIAALAAPALAALIGYHRVTKRR